MNAEYVIERIHAAGGTLGLKGDRIVVELDEDAAPLLDELRAVRDEAYLLLQAREAIPQMPDGVRLVRWRPKPAPVMITRWAVVADVPSFIRHTLSQLEHAIRWERGDKHAGWLAGHRSSRELQDYLEQCGVVISVVEPSTAVEGFQKAV